MGRKYHHWRTQAEHSPKTFEDVRAIILEKRCHADAGQLDYGDHGLEEVISAIVEAIRAQKKIALYADYDVDGTMCCVSWIWFLEAIGYKNYVHYIPCRFSEGYGLNMDAMRHLVDEKGAELIITMDTGITANEEAAYCRSRGVQFICTDHHTIQPDKMPDCLILNPKMHPSESYQELCGCGITFVLLRKLGTYFTVSNTVWNDLLALAGMATICDVVPLNPVNHKLAKLGIRALMRSQRTIIVRLREACAVQGNIDESDVGFRLGPRINAVGRLEHADAIVEAFIDEDPSTLIRYMTDCNDQRKVIQEKIVDEARALAQGYVDSPILFLGGDWHPGVVGIAASKLADEFWKPVWLFQKKEGECKGSARSIPHFDVTAAMGHAAQAFKKFGGHQAAGGYTFNADAEETIRTALATHAEEMKKESPELWESAVDFDCTLPIELLTLRLLDTLQDLKPFGHQFPEPKFRIDAPIKKVQYYNCKKSGTPKHTAITLDTPQPLKVMFFNQVHAELEGSHFGSFIVTATKNRFRGVTSVSLIGVDFL